MGEHSAIGWTNATWSPVMGCTKVSPGCDHCYAERLALGRHRRFYPNGFGEIRLREDRLDTPTHWREGRRIFVCSQSDLFHPRVPFDFIRQVFATMEATPRHTYQVLTKRPGRMAHFARVDLEGIWPQNVEAGTSVESAHYLPRLDVLARVPAPVRFVSAEPLLGPLDLAHIPLMPALRKNMRRYLQWRGDGAGNVDDQLNAMYSQPAERGDPAPFYNALSGEWFDGWDSGKELPVIQWVIAGGESGPGARPLHPDWVRAIRDQCKEAGVPFFFKQWGEWAGAAAGLGPMPYNKLQIHVFPATETRPEYDVYRVGRKAAGALLDGVEHKEMPNA